jgi:hypothetical protein
MGLIVPCLELTLASTVRQLFQGSCSEMDEVERDGGGKQSEHCKPPLHNANKSSRCIKCTTRNTMVSESVVLRKVQSWYDSDSKERKDVNFAVRQERVGLK